MVFMKDLREIYENRRAVNFFDKSKKIEDKTLEDIINLAVLAPSAFNLQPWKIIAVKSEDAKKKLCPLAFNQPKILEAPVTLIITADKNGFLPDKKAWSTFEAQAGKESTEGAKQFAHSLYGTSEEKKIKFAESNAGLLGMSIMYAAQYYGVDSHPINGIHFDGIRKEFSLDEDTNVVMLITLGYFDRSKQLYPRLKRYQYSEIVTEV
jgi:nitroreductase